MISPAQIAVSRVAGNRRRALLLVCLPSALVGVIVLVVVDAAASIIPGVVAGVVIAAVVAVTTWMGGQAVILTTTRARPGDPGFTAGIDNLLEGLCAASGLRVPSVYVIDDDAPNCFTVGRSPRHAAVVVTSGLVERLNRIELEGVLAHELSHVKSGDVVPATVAVTTLVPLVVLAPGATRLVGAAVGSSRETAADVAAVSLTRYPPGLISALETLRSGPRGPVVSGRASARAVSHLWIAPAEAPPEKSESRTEPDLRSLDGRIEALREL